MRKLLINKRECTLVQSRVADKLLAREIQSKIYTIKFNVALKGFVFRPSLLPQFLRKYFPTKSSRKSAQFVPKSFFGVS